MEFGQHSWATVPRRGLVHQNIRIVGFCAFFLIKIPRKVAVYPRSTIYSVLYLSTRCSADASNKK